MIQVLENSTRKRWKELGFSGPSPTRVTFRLSSGVPGKHGKVHFEAFRDEIPEPLFIGKIPRDDTARRWCEHEDAILRDLADAAPRFVGSLFPRVILREDTGGRFACAHTILPGASMERRVTDLGGGQGAARTVYRQAQHWLTTFWAQTGLLEGTEAALWEPMLRSAHFYLERFQPPASIGAEVERLISEIETRRDETALYGFGHGSFSVTNLMVDGDRVGALDWEFGSKRQLPWVDPLDFAIDFSVRHGLRSEGNGQVGFERGFFEDGWLRTLNAKFIADCFTEGGVAPTQFFLALPARLFAALHRSARIFADDSPATVACRERLERCLRPDALEQLEAVFTRS